MILEELLLLEAFLGCRGASQSPESLPGCAVPVLPLGAAPRQAEQEKHIFN